MQPKRTAAFRKITLIVCMAALLTATVNVAAQQVIYVDSAAKGNNNGTSWEDAYNELQPALTKANFDTATQIWVARGTYYPTTDAYGSTTPQDPRTKTFALNKNMKVYGGFSGSEKQLSQRNWKTARTVLHGDIDGNDKPDNNSYHVLYCIGESQPWLDGFVIRGGNANGSSDEGEGGGMYIGPSSRPVVSNCSFVENSAADNGGAIHVNTAFATLTNCSFSTNKAANGGAVSVFSSARYSMLSNCTFSGNEATAYGGAFYYAFFGGPPSILTNCSFSRNRAANGGGGIYIHVDVNNESSTSLLLANSILWQNNGEEIGSDIAISDTEHYPSITSSILQDGCPAIATCTNVRTGDPLFVNAAAGDLRLQPCSPAIDSGDNNANSTTADVEGNVRKVRVIDLGAFEFQDTRQLAPVITRQPVATQTVCQASPATILSVEATGNNLRYQWYRNAVKSNSGGVLLNGETSRSFPPPTNSEGVAYYYAHVIGICDSATSEVAEVVVSKRSIATEASASNSIICNGDSTQLILHGTTGDGAVINWYANAGATQLVGINNGLLVKPTVTTTYYGRFEAPAPCNTPSELRAVTITVNQPSIATQATASRDTVCAGEKSDLVLRGSRGSGAVVRWYSDNDGVEPVGEGNEFAVQPATTTTYYGRFEDPAPCNTSSDLQPVTITVLPLYTWYRDADGDGFGTSVNSVQHCAKPAGYVSDNTDCNDNLVLYRDSDGDGFGADVKVACNGVANKTDCNDLQVTFEDKDGDSYGSNVKVPCGGVTNNSDCNDNSALERPGQTWYIDADGDGYGSGAVQQQCLRPTGGFTALELTATSGDCNDNNDKIYPATQVYVNTHAPPGGRRNGTSWNNAFTSLQDALANAGKCGGTVQIWLAKGTYYPTNTADRTASFVLRDSVTLYGGFSGNEAQLSERRWETNETILSGDIGASNNNSDNSYHVVQSLGNNSTAVLDGVTISGGNANGNSALFNDVGGGILDTLSKARFANCTITGNTANFAGGGVASIHSAATLFNCTVKENNANAGGGLFCWDSPVILNRCSLTGNTATIYGGAIFNLVASPALTNCTISSNTALGGGGIANYQLSAPVLTNCIVANNKATNIGAGLYNENSTPVLTNCVFTKNAAKNSGGAMHNDATNPVIRNSILWGDTAATGAEIFGMADVNHSIVQGGFVGRKIINKNPLFANAAANDLHLQRCSPAIDSGDNNVNTLSIDLDGRNRVNGFAIDLGPFEYQGASCSNAPLPVTFVSVRALPQGEDVQVTWMVAAEQNIRTYVVEHSTDSRTFMNAGETVANNRGTYQFLHLRPGAGDHYYRIRSEEADGSSAYSVVVKAVLGKTIGYFVISPNPPEGNRLNVQFHRLPAGRYPVQLVSSNGQVVFKTGIQHAGGNGTYPLHLSNGLAAGIYQLLVQKPDGETLTEKLLKQ